MDNLPTVVIADVHIEGPMPEYLDDLLRQTAVFSPDRSSPEEIEEKKAEAVAWISRSTRSLSTADLERMPNLRLLSAWGVGHNHIDVATATAYGIPVCINPVFSRSMAEATLTLILALSKRLPALIRDARTGRRPLQSERGIEIRGKSVGIIGFGRIGMEVGELCQRLDMSVLAFDPFVGLENYPNWCRVVSLNELLQTADFVVITAPLTAETRHMIDEPQLSLMKRAAYLVNIARGPLVNEIALLQALQVGRIAGAGLDVWENEPVDPDHPLLALDNVIGTPHRIGGTWESMQQLCQAVQNNVFRVLAGQKPENVINPEVFAKEKNDDH